jgi:23S rRNA pseudouridine1911/1915/1917 synthase
MEENIRDTENEEEDLFEHFNIKVDIGQEIVRIDKFLIDRLPNTSRSKIQSSAKNGNIRVNGIFVKSNYKVKPKDEVSIVLPYPVREIELIPEDIPIDVIFEDEQLIVVNKPSNMVVHPGYGNYRGTLVNALVYHFNNLPQINGDYYGRPGLVHRIDKHTTGLLIIAKTENALTHLAKQFYDRTIHRKYLALVWGDVKQDGTVVGNLGRSPKNRKVMTVFDDPNQGKHAVTHFKVLERFGLVTLVECKLETGRTHQIRVHMKHIGHPLFNDLEYGGNAIIKGTVSSSYKKFIENCFELIPGQALHAATLGFMHPVTCQLLNFEAPIPEGFEMLLNKWKKYTSNAE